MSYLNGSLEIYDNDLNLHKRYFSDIKFVQSKIIDKYLVVSGIRGFNIYDISDKINPILLSAYRDDSYIEFQGVDCYKKEDNIYACFAIYSNGLCIFDITNPQTPVYLKKIPIEGLEIDGYSLSRRTMYTFDLLVNYPFAYSTFAVEGEDMGTKNDCRGIISYNLSDIDDVKVCLYPMDSKDWFSSMTDDMQPTVLRKSGNYLFINASEKGIAYYKIFENGTLNYEGVTPTKGIIKAFDVTDDGMTIVTGRSYQGTWFMLLNNDLILFSNKNNHQKIKRYRDVQPKSIMIDGCVLYKDNTWNTLCLPFSLTEEQVANQLAPSSLMTLSTTSFDQENGILTLSFSEASAIEEGKPYIIRWEEGYNIENPVFYDVTISTTTPQNIETEYVDFCGTFSPLVLTANDNEKLFMSTNNTLYLPSTDITVSSCRAFFKLKGITAGDLSKNASSIKLKFDEISTVNNMSFDNSETSNSWYMLDGRPLRQRPAQNGIYIKNGKKVVINK